jgi:YhcH/YjgK/YiaL family protein
MISGSLSQLHVYKNIHPHLAKAIDHVLQTDFTHAAAGKYEIDGVAIFYMVNEYMTKPAIECEPERHRKYTDIQIMVNGSEKFGYTPFYKQKPSTDFLPDNDVAFYALSSEQLNYIILGPAEFIIFFPADIHQPELYIDAPANVKKVVVKVDMGMTD